MLFDKENDALNPEGTDEQGMCCASDDPDPSWCQSYEYNHDGSEEDYDEEEEDW
jgi:hypothetical protein